MARLKQLLAEGMDPAHNFMYGLVMKGFHSIVQLEASLEEVLAHLLPSTDKHLSRFLQVCFFSSFILLSPLSFLSLSSFIFPSYPFLPLILITRVFYTIS